MIGQKVKLKNSVAKWNTEHPDAFINSSGIAHLDYDIIMQYSIFMLLGGEIFGKIKHSGNDKNVWGVELLTPFGKDFSYYEAKNFEIV